MGFWKGKKLVADRTSSYFKNYTVVCNTPSNELIKEIQIDEFNFSLQDKMHFYVRFTEGHSVTSNKEGSVVTDNYPFLKIKYIDVGSGLIKSTEPIPIKMSGEFVGENFVKENETVELVYWKDLNIFDCMNGDVIWNNKFLFKTKSGITQIPKQMIKSTQNQTSDIVFNTHIPERIYKDDNNLTGDGDFTLTSKGESYYDDEKFRIDYTLSVTLNVHQAGYWYTTVTGYHIIKITPKLHNNVYYYDYMFDVSSVNVQYKMESNTHYNVSNSSNKIDSLSLIIDTDKVEDGGVLKIPFECAQDTRYDQGLRNFSIKDQTITTKLSNVYYG